MDTLQTRIRLIVRIVSCVYAVCIASTLAGSACAADAAQEVSAAEIVRFQLETERKPLTGAQEEKFLQLRLARAQSAMSQLEAATTPETRFYALPDAAMGAFHLGRYSQAAELASETLQKAASFRNDWNFGNAVHYGHMVKGLLALRVGDMGQAVSELHEAGATPGSPQLNSFGPSMLLARRLLQAGESKAVLDYLEQCRRFWKMGDSWLTIWEEKIRRGETPNFVMNLW